MSTSVFVDPESSTQADGAQSSRVPVPLTKDPYEAIRQAYLLGTDTESELFEGEARTPDSPHIVAPPTRHVEESEGFGTSRVRSTSSDSTAPLLPDHPLTHTTPALVPILRKTARMAMHVSHTMSHGLSAGIAEVAAMFILAFRKRFRSSYYSSPSPTLPVRKRYREDEDPTAEDKDLAAEDEGLAAGVEGPAAPVVRTAVSAPLGLGYEALRRRELALEGDHVYSTFEVRQGSGSAPEPERSERIPPLPEWTSGSLPISPSPSIVPSPVSSPMIPLTIPSPIASPMATLTTTILVNEDQFIEVGAQLELYRSILQDHTQRLDAMLPTRFAEIDRDVEELYTRPGPVRDEIFSQRYRFRSLEHEQERIAMTFEALWRPVLTLEAWAGRVDTRMTDMSRAGYDDHRLVHDMLLPQTALRREL
uniref:Uncharacterized protein n=1 Tax=Tanacetum cinerariifolium TaxID=118510 RepID=A0A6L2N244_TANCI|nr:hypothetical protein [Tanacetum cinerariifolium]